MWNFALFYYFFVRFFFFFLGRRTRSRTLSLFLFLHEGDRPSLTCDSFFLHDLCFQSMMDYLLSLDIHFPAHKEESPRLGWVARTLGGKNLMEQQRQ